MGRRSRGTDRSWRGPYPVAVSAASHVRRTYRPARRGHEVRRKDAHAFESGDAAAPLEAFAPDRLVLWGHSFGAFAAVAAATQSDRFSAVIAANGPYNLLSVWGQFSLKPSISPEAPLRVRMAQTFNRRQPPTPDALAAQVPLGRPPAAGFHCARSPDTGPQPAHTPPLVLSSANRRQVRSKSGAHEGGARGCASQSRRGSRVQACATVRRG
ncbi:alpha/beta fold hydrolase [Brevundimonas naejangsanensis]|uniref:alpha/beta fold hydrolase n=1 Tax=Brevundimonas naejangsanensis TaxID=588932 RepID=UPI003AF32073